VGDDRFYIKLIIPPSYCTYTNGGSSGVMVVVVMVVTVVMIMVVPIIGVMIMGASSEW
jgi:hypothetical protein